ncbi:hypothetical protein BDZ91DRAFT_762622 [Kalaharituber pfeilii]|nr:hypothetical protein BDZ91DRAFT_762622 [Kalaharituber pfeilii]
MSSRIKQLGANLVTPQGKCLPTIVFALLLSSHPSPWHFAHQSPFLPPELGSFNNPGIAEKAISPRLGSSEAVMLPKFRWQQAGGCSGCSIERGVIRGTVGGIGEANGKGNTE